MALNLLIPENPAPLKAAFLAGDVALVFQGFATCSLRPIVFCSEHLTIFIVHSSSAENQKTAPLRVYLTTNYQNAYLSSSSFDPLLAQVPVVRTEVNGPINDNNTSVILEQRTLDIISTLQGEKMHVTVWMQTVFVASGCEEGARIRFLASLQAQNLPEQQDLDMTIAQDRTTSLRYQDSSILPDVFESDLMVAHTEIASGVASLQAYVYSPLLLDLKTTYISSSRSRGKSFYVTLRILAPRMPDSLKENLYYSILTLSASSKCGKVVPVAHQSLPVRHTADDLLNITYRVDSHTELAESGSDSLQKGSLANSSKILFLFKFTIKYETKSGGEIKFNPFSSELTVSWSPAVSFSNTFKSAAVAASQARKTAVVSNSVSSTKPSSCSQSTFAPNSSKSGVSATSFSPAFTVTKTGTNLNHKLFRSAAQLPASVLTVTFNLSVPTTSALSGLRLSFSGKLSMSLGEVETWKLQVINTGIRTLQLFMNAKHTKKISRLYLLPNNSSYASASLSTNSKKNEKDFIGIRFNDHHTACSPLQLYHQYNSLKPSRDGIVVLTNDLSLGQLETNQVYETEFELVGFVKGTHTLDGLRIFDVSSGDGIEVGRLLEVFVV